MNESAISDRTFRPKLKKYEPIGHDEATNQPVYPPARYAHWKRDGHMVRFEVDIKTNHWSRDGNTWSAWSRNPTDLSWDVHDCWTELDAFLKGLQSYPEQGKWILLGEMYYPDMPASYVKSGLAHGDKTLNIEFFAILKCPGYMFSELEDLPLQETAYIADKAGFHFVPFFVLDGAIYPKEQFVYATQMVKDIEGFVYKDGNLLNWRRWKNTNTIDLIVTGFTLGEGKYVGKIGSLIVSTIEGYEVASISGMTDEEREEMTKLALTGGLQGLVCEVSYQLVGSKGRLRHPNFVRWRDDKENVDCTLSQDPDLEKVWLPKC